MAVKLGEIFVDVKAKTAGLRKGLSQSRKQVKRLSDTLKRLKGPLLAIGAAGAAAGAALVFAFKKASDAAGIQEQAVTALAVSLRNAGDASQESLRDQLAFAAGLQKVTAFGDEAIIELQALIASFGATGEELKKATAATLDFATVQKVDLKAAAILVGKAFVGEVGTLSRYGIIIDKNIPKTKKFEAVLGELNRQFGGAAEAQRQTFIGQVKALGNNFGDLLEVVGATVNKALIPLVKSVSTSISAFLQNGEAVARLRSSLGTFIAVVVLLGRKLVGLARDTATVFKFLGEVADKTINAVSSFLRLGKSAISTGEAIQASAASMLSFGLSVDDVTAEVRGIKEELGLSGLAADEATLATQRLEMANLGLNESLRQNIEVNQKATEAERMRLAESLAGLEIFGVQFDALQTSIFQKLTVNQLRFVRAMEGSFKAIGGAFSSTFASMIAQGKSANEALKAGFESMKRFFIETVIKSMITAIIGLIVKLLVVKALTLAFGGFFGFQEGGVVGMQGGGRVRRRPPGQAPGPRDRVPALLEPGEVVIPRRIAEFFRGVGFPPPAPTLVAAGAPSVSLLITGNTFDSEERVSDVAEMVKENVLDALMQNTRITS